VNYSAARADIKSGDLLVWSHRGWNSLYDAKVQAVRFFTKSEYSHVGVAWVVGGRVLVIEAVIPKVRIYPLSRLGSFYHVPGFIQWTPETEEKALGFVGADYSQLEAVAAFFGISLEKDKQQCAKLVTTLACGFPLNLTPSAVVDWALGNGLALHKVDLEKQK
jgi:hypothetical protein